ncbi:MAG: glycosyltransferase family 39 protein [Mojavia pulchra JT2-VF2]|jgi:4-amino-4-deoxy-L-arabinose transferase-like glycosyltransferase|uniref:Glycosyltransferase family 39 protein n=1 Tax=Mojavia pulchra JT2-VF2 TaxID=287848 RepID=A0A951UEZ1_9NOST|nr:glycosyltransferase family 39 protein [Mojavia pulchra JT2-VF2]
MLYKLRLFQAVWRQIRLFSQFDYFSLLLWILPLLLCNSGQNSLMAHDEGYYAWRSRLIFDTGDWIAPWGDAHHKTPGPYWLIASSYKLFGISEISARFPSMVAGIFCLFIIYELGKIILGKRVAWLASLILSLEFLWLQSSRLAAPDIPMIMLVLLAILSLLKAELYPKHRYFLVFIAGLSFGLGFLLRSFMIFLPMIALLPYLIWEHRRHRHLTNPMFYLGLLVGLIPSLVWLWLNWLRYGYESLAQLLGFVIELGSEDRNYNGILFYIWNIPLKSFPWFFFGLLGLALLLYRPIARYQMILVGFPVVLFAELSLFSTRLSHYALCLYPFIAMLAAVGLGWLGTMYEQGFIYQTNSSQSSLPRLESNILFSFLRKARENLPRNFSYAFGVLGIVLLLVSIFAFNSDDGYIRQRAILCLILGLGWLIVPLVWIGRYHFGKKFLTNNYWVASYLIPAWLTLAMAGSLGVLSDYNPAFRVFFQQPAIASILQTHPVYFLQPEDKNSILLNFYTPIHGKQVNTIAHLPPLSYAWISAQQKANLSQPYRVIATLQQYQLIQVLS